MQLKISRSHLKSWKILRQSIDARKKPELFFVYLIEAEVDNERTIVKKLHNPSIVIVSGQTYTFPKEGVLQQKHRPVIIGTGPAGLFCGYLLAQHGYRPILLERGSDVDNRSKKLSISGKQESLMRRQMFHLEKVAQVHSQMES